MAIAPLDGARDGARSGESGLRLVRGDRPVGAAPRGTARHAASELTEALRRSRAAHPTAQAVRTPLRVPTGPRPGAVGAERAIARRVATIERRAARRTSHRAATMARRRSTAGLGTVVAAIVLLALPLHALGAVTLDGRPTPGGVPAGLAPGSVYVVQSGDSIASIAQRVNPAQTATIEHELVASTGSRTVVPGEHVVVP
jgi:hypothetical protein